MRIRYSLLLLTLCLLFSSMGFSPPRVVAFPTANVTNDQPEFNFPDSLTFQATIENTTSIQSVILEYGTNELTCGEVVAKAFPEITPDTSVDVAWTWEMKQSGSLPPGATIWWRWRYTEVGGVEYVSDQKTTTWLDTRHNWQVLTADMLNLHWYTGDQGFAQELLDAAVSGLERLQNDAGLQPVKPIHLYIYANTSDMKDAILYEPSWTGGMAFPEHDIVIIGITPADLAWGRDTIAHELTHVLVGHLTFSCLGDVPTWLNEGLAVYSEGELDPASKNQLEQAILDDQLLTIRSLSGGFSEVPSRAYLSYSQSYSIVKYLIETYGQQKIDKLLFALRDGTTIEDALVKVYGFDLQGLEERWRGAIGAAPHAAPANPTAQPTPTFVPTFVPYAGAPLAITPTPYVLPTSSAGEPSAPSTTPPLSLTVFLVAICCILSLLLVVIGLRIYLSKKTQRGDENEI